jgi:hypothetical protein
MKWILAALILASTTQQPAPAVEMTPVETQFQQMMSNVILVGFFTMGDNTELHNDRYVIDGVTKVKDGVWRFAARVQFNNKDVAVALNVPVFFAGDTPVISLPRQAIEGLGTYDARVVFYKSGYAGTWGGGTGGGKMFGNIVKNDAAAAPKP